jgi:hypothetical protein
MRPNRLSRPRRIAASTAVVLGLLVAGTFAYWSNTGQANASASLATLSAPTITNATAGAQTVELTWSAVTPPASGTVEYFVARDGGAPGSGCPSSSSRSTATSCTDTGMTVGAHEYTVTAVWRTWTASASKTVTVAFGPATHLVLEAASTTPTAGEADNLTVVAKDASNDTVGTYSGSHSLIFEGAGEAGGEEPVVIDRSGVEKNFGEETEITFSEGKATVSSATNGVMTLYKAEAAHIKVKEGSLNNSTGLAVTVKAAAAKKLSVPTPSEQEAGAAFNVTLTATDEYGNTATSYAGKKTITWSEPANSPSGKAPIYTTAITFTAGVGAAASTRLYDAQTTTLKAKEGTTAIEGTSASFTVKAAVAKKFTVPTPSEQEAGAPFNVTLTAIDEYSNTATSYAGAKTLVWSGPANAPNATAPEYPASATAVTFTAGVGTASALKLYDAQSTTLKAKEGTIEVTTGSFTVKAAAAASFSLPTPAEQTAGTAFNETLTAWDPWHNTAKSYAGAKTLTFSEPSLSPSGQAPIYPATVTFTAGAGTASIKLYDAQSTVLKAKEGAIEGTTGTFAVKAAATKKLSVPTPSEQEAGVAFNLTLTATDEYGNLAKSYTGAKTIAWSGPSSSPNATPPEYPSTATAVTFTEGVGAASSLKLPDAQSTTLKAKEGTIEGTAGTFTVKAAVAERFAWEHAEVTAGAIEAGTCPFACKTTSIGASKKFKAHPSVTDAYGNIVSNLGATVKAKVEKTSGEGTLANAAGLTIPAAGLAESATIFEYTSPASGTSEAVLKLKSEEGAVYTEAEAHVKY